MVDGERSGVTDGIGKAKVADGTAVGETEGVGVREGVGVGDGVGVGMILLQRCSGTVAPPTAFTNSSQRFCSFSKSGGPQRASAVPGKIRYVTLRSLTGRL